MKPTNRPTEAEVGNLIRMADLVCDDQGISRLMRDRIIVVCEDWLRLNSALRVLYGPDKSPNGRIMEAIEELKRLGASNA